MNRIDWSNGFIGVDGIFRSQAWIERWYRCELLGRRKAEKKIYENAGRIKNWMIDILKHSTYGDTGNFILGAIIDNLPNILTASPAMLECIADMYDAAISEFREELDMLHTSEDTNKIINTFNSQILTAFGYKQYRSSVLPSIAEYINVKCCPYCNLNYTMLTYDKTKSGRALMAKFQFDHFFDKDTYPLLSMSLYNLIPSCANCNLSKKNKRFSLDFHPYYSDISKKLKFELLQGKSALILGGGADIVDVKVIAEDSKDADIVNDYDEGIHLSAMYSRHRDIIEEIAAQIYVEENYYSDGLNFGFLKFTPFTAQISQEVIHRIQFGNYDRPEDIHKRPMAKFRQDIYKSLKS